MQRVTELILFIAKHLGIFVLCLGHFSKADFDPEKCSRQLNLTEGSGYYKTRTGAYLIHHNGSIEFHPDNLSQPKVINVLLFDSSHRAILNRNSRYETGGFGEYSTELIRGDQQNPNIQAFKAALPKSRKKVISSEARQMLYEILLTEGRLNPDRNSLIKEILTAKKIKQEDEIAIIIKYTNFVIDFGNDAWEPITLYSYNRFAKEPVEDLHVWALYRMRSLLASRVRAVSKGAIAVLKEKNILGFMIKDGDELRNFEL